jgi:uncharacterized phiE125 gp8 family phage protein
MNVEVIERPPFFPVTLREVYTHLRLTPEGSPPEHPDDSMLLTHIGTATGAAERYTRRSIIRQVVRLHLPRFPCYAGGINLLRPPVLSVEAVSYYDDSNQLQSIPISNWYVSDDLVPQLRFVNGFGFPTTYCRPDAIRVDYIAGYEPEGSPPTTQDEYAANVPYSIKSGILIGVELLYDSLSPEQRNALEKGRAAMLDDYKVYLKP